MNKVADLLLEGPWLAPRALTPLERLMAAKNWSSGAGRNGWAATFLLLLALIVAVAALAVILYRRWMVARQQRDALDTLCREFALGERERYVLVEIAKLARTRSIDTVFTVPTVFERGRAALMNSARVTSMTEERRSTIAELAESIREKLGLPKPNGPAGDGGYRDDPHLAQGDRLKVVHRGQSSDFEVRVADSSADDLVVTTPEPVDFRPGETWLVRYSRNGLLWEMDASVVGGEGDRVRLSRASQARFINRRRFPRVTTRRQARIARFPTWRSDVTAGRQEFVDGELIEIAGPGLRLRAPLEARPGDRLLLTVNFAQDNVLEGVGQVRRAIRGEGRNCELVVELLGLTDVEIARLTQETNAAARANRGAEGPAPVEGRAGGPREWTEQEEQEG